jgi:hypothetical protein
MGQDVECAHLCDVSLDKAAARQIYDLIHDEYLVEWYISQYSQLMHRIVDVLCLDECPIIVESSRGNKFRNSR